MRYVACAIYVVLILPLLPLVGLCRLGDKLEEAKWPERWVDWAVKKSRDITGV